MEDDMACPKHGTEYVTIGDKRVCPKCGHVPGYKQINIIEVLEENERLKREVANLKATLSIFTEGTPRNPMRRPRMHKKPLKAEYE